MRLGQAQRLSRFATLTFDSDSGSVPTSADELLALYRWMRLTRTLEERLVALYRQTKVVGGLFRSLGQEACAVGSAYALERTDVLSPLIRNLALLRDRTPSAEVVPIKTDGKGGARQAAKGSAAPNPAAAPEAAAQADEGDAPRL